MAHVVIIGAGYAGLHAARAAMAARADVTVLDPDGRHALLPRFAGIASGAHPVADGVVPVRELLDVRLRAGRAEHVDVARREIHLEGAPPLRYDALVVTAGAGTRAGGPPGAAEHAHGIGDLEQVTRLRGVLATAGSLVVVGAGATGIELAALAAQTRPGLRVHLVEAASDVLATEPPPLRRHARRLLDQAGVQTEVDADVVGIDRRGVRLADGRHLPGVVVWAGGWQADGTALLPDADARGGRLRVERDLRVIGAPGVLAAGDVADHVDVLGRPLAMSAQIAVRAGETAGHNAAALLAGRTLRAARLVELGRVVPVGSRRGVARLGPLRLGASPTDLAAPALHLAIDLRHLAQLGGLGAVARFAPGRRRPVPADGEGTRRGHLAAVG
jgi:NADH:ubiquinone reductase (H+-translocating)